VRIRLDPPVPGAYIIFENVDTGEMICVKTDENGRARAWIREGTWWIHVFKEGYIPYSRLVEVHGDVSLTITLSPAVAEVTFEDAIKKLSPSGLDPNDEAWRPSDGWTYIFDLHRVEDALAFAFMDKEMLGFPEHMCYAYLVDEYEGSLLIHDGGVLARYMTTVYLIKLAIAVKLKTIQSGGTAYVHVVSDDGTNSYDCQFNYYPDRIELKDLNSNLTVSSSLTYDWIVYVFDFTATKHYVLDKDKNILISQNLSATPSSGKAYAVEIPPTSAEVQIDWIALKTSIMILY